jgi:hydrogenase nickel incorporation protein HypB
MCQDCGCGDNQLVPVEVQTRLLEANDRTAGHNREHFEASGVLAINLMGSPGSGKTALLEATAHWTSAGLRIGAVSGDLETDNDARRLTKAGIPARAITTGTGCHLDAELVHKAVHGFPLSALDVFFIENVGNLVCPAIYDLGQAANVVALSITEGEDKPLKYPTMFRAADLVVLTKLDLLPHLDVSVEAIEDALARVMPSPRMIAVSAKTGAGIDSWMEWIAHRRNRKHPTPVEARP